MKNSNNIVTIILGVAVVALFLLHFFDRPKESGNSYVLTDADSTKVVRLPLAYVNLDSLLRGYDFSRDLQEKMLSSMEKSQATINQQGRALEQDMADFQRKIENNAFFDQGRAQREQERILKRQQDFQMLSQRLQAEMMQEQQEMNQMLNDTIMSQIRDFNDTQGHYQLILTNTLGDNLLYADEIYDITTEVIAYLNSRYKPEVATAVKE